MTFNVHRALLFNVLRSLPLAFLLDYADLAVEPQNWASLDPHDFEAVLGRLPHEPDGTTLNQLRGIARIFCFVEETRDALYLRVQDTTLARNLAGSSNALHSLPDVPLSRLIDCMEQTRCELLPTCTEGDKRDRLKVLQCLVELKMEELRHKLAARRSRRSPVSTVAQRLVTSSVI